MAGRFCFKISLMTTPVETDVFEVYRAELENLRDQGRMRALKSVEIIDGVQCKVAGQNAINFSSNDYLGLSQDERLKQAAIAAIQQHGTGSGSSRLIAGSSPEVQKLEENIAAWKHTEAALVFNSGYQANVAIAQALFDKNTHVFADKLNHASLVDGMLLAGCKWTRYTHLDMDALAQKLSQAPKNSSKWIVTDSLFSMDGDYGNLSKLCSIAEEHGAHVLIDEAHAAGVFGNEHASGLAEAFAVQNKITLQMGTFSKALGGFGAYVAGPKVLIDTLINKARGLIYSTALPPAMIATAQAAIDLVQADRSMKEALWRNIHSAHAKLAEAGFPKSLQPTQIMPIHIGDDAKTMQAMQQLLEAGYFVQGVRPPTVPEGSSRLRISLSALHTSEQLDGLIHALAVK